MRDLFRRDWERVRPRSDTPSELGVARSHLRPAGPHPGGELLVDPALDALRGELVTQEEVELRVVDPLNLALFTDMNDCNKEGALGETGFSTTGWPNHYESDQSNWVSCAVSNIDSIASSQNTNNPSHPMLFANFYELADINTGALGWINNFGLLHTDLSQKQAYATFRQLVPSASS